MEESEAMKKTHIGVDFSMTCPAICIHTADDDSWSIRNCKFHYLTDKKKFEGKQFQFEGKMRDEHSSNEMRFDQISKWVIATIQPLKAIEVSRIVIEGYAFGAKGKVFEIAENTGLMKHVLWRNGFDFDVAAPTVLKKFATGKGNANKEAMQEAFIAETKTNPKKLLDQSPKSWNPSSDIIDAYYACKYAHHLSSEYPNKLIVQSPK